MVVSKPKVNFLAPIVEEMQRSGIATKSGNMDYWHRPSLLLQNPTLFPLNFSREIHYRGQNTEQSDASYQQGIIFQLNDDVDEGVQNG